MFAGNSLRLRSRAFFSSDGLLSRGQVTEQTDVLLDRYIAFRAATGHPLTRKEFEEAARYSAEMGGYGPKVAKAIAVRARRAGINIRLEN